jgi:plastocyanin
MHLVFRLALAGVASAAAAGTALAGDVEGVVRHAGEPPPPARIEVAKDRATCGSEVLDDAVRVRDGRLADAVVTLAGPGLAPAAPVRVRLGQERCRFVPRVLVAPVGSTLEVVNADPVLHTVNGWADRRPRFSVVTPGAGATGSARLDRPGEVRVSCDVHAWMRAVVAVVDGPAALSAADGTFALRGIPPGRYTLRAWHERLGERTAELDVPAEGAVRVELTLPPQPR